MKKEIQHLVGHRVVQSEPIYETRTIVECDFCKSKKAPQPCMQCGLDVCSNYATYITRH